MREFWRYDFALVTLDRPTTVPPLRLMTADLAQHLTNGATATVIGYGSRPFDGSKRRGTVTIASSDCTGIRDCARGIDILRDERRRHLQGIGVVVEVAFDVVLR